MYNSPIPYRSDASIYFAAIRELSCPAWLDSGDSARFDILTAQPVATLTTRGEHTEICDDTGTYVSSKDPFAVVRECMGIHDYPLESEFPFAGGAVGYWGYDLARKFQHMPDTVRNAEEMPEMAVGIYDWAIIIDHENKSGHLVSRLHHKATEKVLPQLLKRLRLVPDTAVPIGTFKIAGSAVSNLTPALYKNAFDAVQGYLHAGDCYQVNLAQRYSAGASGDAFAAYLQLRKLSHAPYSAFIDWPQFQVLCASPERFLKVTAGRVVTKPIKGTRPRNKDNLEDGRLAEELRHHPKDRAENLMIVDLLRNDLSKSCVTGSVHVSKLFEVESFDNVHHLVSTIEGTLKKGIDALDVLRDCFPGGSVTGAPKCRAMEIIDQLEPNRREIYCGAIGYLGFDGNMDTNIVIRTLVYSGGEIRYWAGGGIVADSQCESEYQETLDKASAMMEILKRFRSAES